MQIIHVVGARPNFMKVAPVIRAVSAIKGIEQILVHTGQHYDHKMSEVFFHELDIPEPDINLEVGSASHAAQTAQIMIRFEEVVLKQKPDLVLVYGDVNSTVAAALVCSKLGTPVAHVEAGLRSNDRSMPEEINRLVTDQIADLLFTPSVDGDENLLHEGIKKDKIYMIGNVMIDTLVRLLPKAQHKLDTGALDSLVGNERYCLVTLHRPSNVDDPYVLKEIFIALNEISQNISVLFPIHPRTRERLQKLNLGPSHPGFKLENPLSYLDFLALQTRAAALITDSGGIQEETTYLGIPCLTIRNNTERPVTLTLGTNILIGQDMRQLKSEVTKILSGNCKKGTIPPLWEGKAGERIADVITKKYLR